MATRLLHHHIDPPWQSVCESSSVEPRAPSMAATLAKQLSLVQQKRLQWAREREELANLCAPWGFHPKESTDSFRSSIRTQYVSTTQLHDIVRDSVQETILGRQRQRSPSLPPICRPATDLAQSGEGAAAREEEGDTSGYASEGCATDCGRQVNMWPSSQNRGYASPESVASTPSCRWSGTGSGTDEASRLRWGDRGVGVGHLWEPSMAEPDCRLPQVASADTPSWLERGLRRLGVGPGSTTVSEGGAQVLILNHDAGSGPTSPISVQSHQHRTYILGQNVHLEPEELMEREIKRQKALEHQKAIRQQLEERDRRRKEERERRIREEQEEEERIRRDQEMEAHRLREEQRRQKEKEEKDARRAQAIREALEEAERRALLERPTRLQLKKQQQLQQQQQPDDDEDAVAECRMCDKSDANTPRGRLLEEEQRLPAPPATAQALAPLRATLEAGPMCTAESLPVVAAEGVAVMLDSVGVSSPGLQLALLVPQQPSRKDTSTQTEVSPRGGKTRKKSASLERPGRDGRPLVRSRSRSQSQPRGPLPLEERPKWGVNRPGHAYVKQSERDPHYQRRQQRGRIHTRNNVINNNNHALLSSDENSRSPSPSAASVTGKTSMASRRRGGAGPLLDLRPHLAGKHHRHHLNIPNGNGGQRLLNRRNQEEKPKRNPSDEDLWSSVRPVVTQLTSLRQCLLLKHQEWETPRSQTPFSEKSWNA